MLNPDNTTAVPDAADLGVAFSGASFTTDVAFPTSAATNTLPSSTAGSNAKHSGSSGLSTGAKAAIGVGVAAEVIIGSLLGLWIFSRRRAQKSSPKQNYSLSELNPSQKNLTTDAGSNYGLRQ